MVGVHEPQHWLAQGITPLCRCSWLALVITLYVHNKVAFLRTHSSLASEVRVLFLFLHMHKTMASQSANVELHVHRSREAFAWHFMYNASGKH
eukprot:scaffold66600_cov20-Tisochrysis_lutea.AAC.1